MPKRSSPPMSEVFRRWLRADRDSEAEPGAHLFRHFMRHLPGDAWLKDAAGRYVYVNEAAAHSLGRSAADIVGKRNIDLLDPDEAQQCDESDRKAAEAGSVRVTESYRHSDGTKRSVLVSKFRVFGEGDEALIGGVAIDITDRVDAEARLQRSEERMRLALRGANAGAWVYNADTQAAYWSREFRNLFGFEPDAPSSLDVLMARVHPDDREHTRDHFVRMLRTGRGEFRQEFRILHPHLGLRWMMTLGRVDRQDDVVTCHGISLDITRLKLVEDELRIQDQRKNEFLATLAHELRNPLAPIRNGLEILRVAPANSDMGQQARTMMERQLKQMVRLIDDLLDLSRISRGKIELKRERIELAPVVHDAVEISLPLIEQANHQLTLEISSESMYVDADATRLAQVFANLLNNAAKYTNDGGRIHVRVQRMGDLALVSVRDNGIGIPAEMIPKVFEMFTQVDRSLEKAQGGLGIGLSIARQLVEMHGGSIEASSEGLGAGSEFRVFLPLASAQASALEVADRPSQGATTGLKILLADDNLDAANSLALMLQINGNEVRTARDGIEAIEVAQAFEPHVILLDIGMPRMNGYDACQRLRQLEVTSQCLIVATTGWGQDDDIQRSREAGFDHHLVKPIEARALEALLAREPARRTTR